jgi:hypothetical protein
MPGEASVPRAVRLLIYLTAKIGRAAGDVDPGTDEMTAFAGRLRKKAFAGKPSASQTYDTKAENETGSLRSQQAFAAGRGRDSRLAYREQVRYLAC